MPFRSQQSMNATCRATAPHCLAWFDTCPIVFVDVPWLCLKPACPAAQPLMHLSRTTAYCLNREISTLASWSLSRWCSQSSAKVFSRVVVQWISLVKCCTNYNKSGASHVRYSIGNAFRLHDVQDWRHVLGQGIISSSDFRYVGANIGVQCSSASRTSFSRVNISYVGISVIIRPRQDQQLVRLSHPSVQSSYNNRLALSRQQFWMRQTFCMSVTSTLTLLVLQATGNLQSQLPYYNWWCLLAAQMSELDQESPEDITVLELQDSQLYKATQHVLWSDKSTDPSWVASNSGCICE